MPRNDFDAARNGASDLTRTRACQVAHERPERADEARAHTCDRDDDAALCDHRYDAPAQACSEKDEEYNGDRGPPHFFAKIMEVGR